MDLSIGYEKKIRHTKSCARSFLKEVIPMKNGIYVFIALTEFL